MACSFEAKLFPAIIFTEFMALLSRS